MYCSFCIIETTNIAFGNRCNVEDLRIFCNKVKKNKISWNHKNKEMCYNKISLLTLNFNILINYETCYNNHIIDWVLLDSKPWTLAKWIFNHVSNKWHMSFKKRTLIPKGAIFRRHCRSIETYRPCRGGQKKISGNVNHKNTWLTKTVTYIDAWVITFI